MKQPKILDCTLRDGGYYNDWDFSSSLVLKLLTALDSSGVDIVELGYKAPPQPGFSGLYRYCPETQLQFLRTLNRADYAFMIDAREFLTKEGKVDRAAVSRWVLPARESIFTWCRVATHNSTVEGATELVRVLRGLGYRTCYNAMGISLLTEAQIAAQLRAVAASEADVFYFADSFGSLRPDDVLRYLKLIRGEYRGEIGIHTHDNQGLAFANSEAAIEAGVDFVDGTVTGMGRGAGNLKTEQLLLSQYFRHGRTDLDPHALVEVIEQEFMPLQAQYNWGWDFTYMVSGLQNIHPTYCQKLKSTRQFTMRQVASILRAIPHAQRHSFNADTLTQAADQVLPLRAKGSELVRVPVSRWSPRAAESVLVVGSGPLVKEHAAALRQFILEHRPLVIECNHTGALDGMERIVAVLNEVRLAERSAGQQNDPGTEVITGLESVPAELGLPSLRHVPCSIRAGTVAIADDRVTIPAYVVGMFAVAVALQTGASRIWLAGFDGFADSAHAAEQHEMEEFWKQLAGQTKAGVEMVSLLPTTYSLETRSIYSLVS